MGFLDRFRRPAPTTPTPFSPPSGPPATSQSINVNVGGQQHTITISYSGGGRAIPGLPNDPPTLPPGGHVNVVGESYYEEAFLRLTGGRCREGFSAPCTARLVPEPDNPYDPMAVAVHIGQHKVGHLSREEARAYRPYLDETIQARGLATASATLNGGWDRGGGDVGSFGLVLSFSDRPERAPDPGINEIRLRGSNSISVSNEEHYQAILVAASKGRDLRLRKYPVAAELHLVDANPHVKKAAGPVLEVRIEGAVVGYLTPAMSERFGRLAQRAIQEGKTLSAAGVIGLGTKGGNEIAEITLTGTPMALDEFVVPTDGFELTPDQVQSRRTGKVHRVKESLADGSCRTECGSTIKSGDVVRLLSSKPWVGLVRPESRELIPEGSLDRCERC